MSDLNTFFSTVGNEAANDFPTAAQPAVPVGIGLPTPKADVSRDTVSAWAVSDDRYWGISHSIDRIEAGCYAATMTDNVGVLLMKQALRTDTLIELPDSKSEAVIAEITQFTTLKPAFTLRGLLYKRGVLLWGPPGSGKTSTLHLLMRLIVDRLGGIALIVDHPTVAAQALQLIRKIEPERQVIAIMEDVDGLVGKYGPSGYLALLDGEAQVDNVVFVATTNYPERLDRRFVDRPSRFDTVEYVGMPTAEARRVYLLHKEPALADAILEAMVESTEGLSIAHLREMIILTQCFGRTVEQAAERLNAFKHRTPDSGRSPDRSDAGFGNLRLKTAAGRLASGAAAGGMVRNTR